MRYKRPSAHPAKGGIQDQKRRSDVALGPRFSVRSGSVEADHAQDPVGKPHAGTLTDSSACAQTQPPAACRAGTKASIAPRAPASGARFHPPVDAGSCNGCEARDGMLAATRSTLSKPGALSCLARDTTLCSPSPGPSPETCAKLSSAHIGEPIRKMGRRDRHLARATAAYSPPASGRRRASSNVIPVSTAHSPDARPRRMTSERFDRAAGRAGVGRRNQQIGPRSTYQQTLNPVVCR